MGPYPKGQSTSSMWYIYANHFTIHNTDTSYIRFMLVLWTSRVLNSLLEFGFFVLQYGLLVSACYVVGRYQGVGFYSHR